MLTSGLLLSGEADQQLAGGQGGWVGTRCLRIQTHSISASPWPGFSSARAWTQELGTNFKKSVTVALDLPTQNLLE